MSILDISKYSEIIIDHRLKQIEQNHIEKLQIIASNYHKCYQNIMNNQSKIKNNQDDILSVLKTLISKTEQIQSEILLINSKISLLESNKTL